MLKKYGVLLRKLFQYLNICFRTSRQSDSRTSGESSQSSCSSSNAPPVVVNSTSRGPADGSSYKQTTGSSGPNHQNGLAQGVAPLNAAASSNHQYSTSSSSSGISGAVTNASAGVNINKVKQKTDQLTKKIKVMWQACQDQRQELFVTCSDNIRILVTEFISLFSQVRKVYNRSNFGSTLFVSFFIRLKSFS